MDNDFDTDMDFDSTDSGATDNIESTASETDQVAALLMEEDGEEYPEQALRDNAKTKIYNADDEKLNNKTWTTTPIDRHGNRDYSGGEGDSFTREAPKAPEYGFSGNDIQQNMSRAQEQWDQAHKANEELETAYRNGDITHEEYQRGTHMAGQYAGQAKTMAYENRIAMYEYERQKNHAYAQLEKEFPEFGEATRDATLRETAEWMRSQGLSDDILREVEDPNVVAVCRRTMKALQRDQAQQIEITGLRARLKQANKALGRGKKTAERGRQLGQRKNGPVGENQLEQITDLLFGSDK